MPGSTSYGHPTLAQRELPLSSPGTNTDLSHSFKVTEVAFMMDWDDSGSSSDDDTDGLANVTKAVSQLGETAVTTTRGSMRGLQLAIQEGWLVQRARDMCSFAHDRYRQAAQAEAATLPDGSGSKMSFKVSCNFMRRSF